MRLIDTASSSGSRVISSARPALIGLAALLALTAALLAPAIANGFPLVFPDSGTYLGIATGSDYAIDRSSVYGLLLKPFVRLWPGAGGLWLAIAGQAMSVAGVLLLAARMLIGTAPTLWRVTLLLLATTLFSSLPWHAAQFMPDAFTGPLVLLACLTSTRSPSASGAALLWLGALVLALTHYTHVVVLAAAATAAVLAQLTLGLPWREAAARLGVALGISAIAVGMLAISNGAVLGRATMSPVGPVFLFARLHEDGLIDRWLDGHCGRDAPAPLCAARATIDHDSQTLLWRDPQGPVARHIWQPADDAERWRWVEMMAQANRGAILEQPGAFLASAVRGTVGQLLAFRALDDECPGNCGRDRTAGVGYALARDRPEALRPLDASMQLRGTTPKSLVRAITTPVAALSLLLLPVAALIAWRRRDSVALAFSAAIVVALVVNAALAGALSDVHDRYQSRLIWLAPFLILALAGRWWRRPTCPPGPAGA